MKTDLRKPHSQRIILPSSGQVDLAQASALDLCTLHLENPKKPATAVFIRPPTAGIDHLVGGEDIQYYLFNGLSVSDLNELTMRTLRLHGSFHADIFSEYVLGTFYPIERKDEIYEAIADMHLEHKG